MAPPTAQAQLMANTTPTTFHKFCQLPQHIQDDIWNFAVRDDRPSAHFFTASNPRGPPLIRGTNGTQPPTDTVYSSYPSGRGRTHSVAHFLDSQIATGLSAPWIDGPGSGPGSSSSSSPSSSSHTESQQLVTTNPQTRDNRFRKVQQRRRALWAKPSNPSIYLEDSGLWNACIESRDAMINRFGQPGGLTNDIRLIRKLAREFHAHPRTQGLWFRQIFNVEVYDRAKLRRVTGRSLRGLPPRPLVANFDFDTFAPNNTITPTGKSGETSLVRRRVLRDMRQMTITAKTDLLVLQPPRQDENGGNNNGGGGGSRPCCRCDLTRREMAPQEKGRQLYIGLMGGMCDAYEPSSFRHLMDRAGGPVDNGEPVFSNIGMVFDTKSHLVQIPWPSATQPHQQQPTGWYGGYFRRHLMRILSSLTGCRDVENFWMIDYRLKYVTDGETSSSPPRPQRPNGHRRRQDRGMYPALPPPLHGRKTFKTRDFELVELGPQDFPSHSSHNGGGDPATSLSEIQAQEDATAVLPAQYGHDDDEMHALKALRELLVWKASNMPREEDESGKTRRIPNIGTDFRVLGIMVKGPPKAGWKRARPRGKVYFESPD